MHLVAGSYLQTLIRTCGEPLKVTPRHSAPLIDWETFKNYFGGEITYDLDSLRICQKLNVCAISETSSSQTNTVDLSTQYYVK